MKTLILMRHAKSDWSTPGQRDFDRPLAPRGQRSSRALGDWLRQKGLVPQLALVSAARRTRETFVGLDLGDGTRAEFVPALYGAAPGTYFSLPQNHAEDVVLMIGHNPTIAEVSTRLLRATPIAPELAAYPTGATLAFDFDIPDWSALDSAVGTLREWIIPRKLVD